ncbi:MAG: hypothetical protein U5P10_04480 [Spirochaetia bacterium]|nr:hypothetical protein [Spirochaetia bacterium]
MTKTRKTSIRLSVIIIILSTIASMGGIFIKDLYQDNFLVTSGWYGNDFVTLFLAVPMLAISLMLSKRGSQRAQLVLLGMFFYTLYNYAFYLFGAAFNSLFLIYVALFTLSIYTLIFGVSSLNLKVVTDQFSSKTPTKIISGYMIIVSVLLGAFHVSLSLKYVFTGQIPEFLILLDKSTNIISALDLSLTVSLGLLGAFWLWKRQQWGYVVAVIWNVKSFVYLSALSATTFWGFKTGASESIIELTLWVPIAAGCLISSILLLKNMKTLNKQ